MWMPSCFPINILTYQILRSLMSILLHTQSSSLLIYYNGDSSTQRASRVITLCIEYRTSTAIFRSVTRFVIGSDMMRQMDMDTATLFSCNVQYAEQMYLKRDDPDTRTKVWRDKFSFPTMRPLSQIRRPA